MSREKSKIRHPIGEKPLNIGAAADRVEVMISIDGLVSGGRGVGRENGRVWFVHGAVPGDRVWARAERVKPRFVEGIALRVERPSSERRISLLLHRSEVRVHVQVGNQLVGWRRKHRSSRRIFRLDELPRV